MHHFLLIYFNSKLLHDSSRLAAHHQEDRLIENSACCGFMFYRYTTIHGQQNIKNICAKFTSVGSVCVNLAQIILSVFYIFTYILRITNSKLNILYLYIGLVVFVMYSLQKKTSLKMPQEVTETCRRFTI
jgi:hypothetical protein